MDDVNMGDDASKLSFSYLVIQFHVVNVSSLLLKTTILFQHIDYMFPVWFLRLQFILAWYQLMSSFPVS